MRRHVLILSPKVFGISVALSMCGLCLLLSGLFSSTSAQGIQFGRQGETRAVIIGISEYANEEIEDLQFAHKDAEAFYEYITSPAGGSVDPANIKLLTNDKATYGKINEVMDWLMENSDEGDRAIIFFSGHGDVETVSKRKQGFLLTYDSPSRVYRAGAYPIYYLQITLETLADANVETIVITDACRSGKLAGNDFGGAQATALALQQQFANEVKIMSCQPNEFSLEGSQWGGGRSVFSYYLLLGLKGIADKDQDGIVTLMEIDRYLVDEVTSSVAPKQQIPLVEGDRNSPIAVVDDETLRSLINETMPAYGNQANPNGKTANNGEEGADLSNLSMEARALLSAFEASVKTKDLSGGEKSAYTIYQVISQNQELTDYKNKLSRQLSTALQEEAQKAINLYLESDASELNDRWNFSEKYSRFPVYLEKAAELLPADHYSLNWLKCNQLYFEGLLMRLDWEKKRTDKSKLIKARSLQLQALTYDEYSAHVYNELGLIYSDLGDAAKEIESYLKALELSPNWAMPNSNLAVAYMESGELNKAIPYLETAIREKPNQAVFYLNMSMIYKAKKDYPKAIEYIENAILLDSFNLKWQFGLIEYLLQQGKIEEAREVFVKIEKICWDQPNCINDLAIQYYSIKDYEGYFKLLNKGLSMVEKDDERYIMFRNNLTYYYLAVEDRKTFESLCLDLIKEDIARPSTIIDLASYYAQLGETSKAMEYLSMGFEKGYSDVDAVLKDKNFESIKGNTEFKKLIERYRQ